ncbi:FAD-dependent oxidoreductase [Persicimonas caeni]|uniref:FAD-dependent oxidoreductase n=1 Tax=Persicimonas caeni TaxID=2292766 RepID=A0A4Y6PM97_PERCE|nr:NAD(P)/FAD-dependent oxidoreductase [Persicimonas caeni]QDG49436.1 FAD-dependent oxidoreductase [Persicimonas caeni]QED30657.1 FAD-dependent oxidoreductase [Persicimonas caeni]
MERVDVAVIGAGFGGLACALRLAEAGAKVALFERLTYPGGCASTFKRRGYRFEAGATLFSGFGEGQLFREWMDRYDLDVEFQQLDPVVRLRTGRFELDVPPHRDRFIERFCKLPGAPKERLRKFFAWQEKVADALWELFDDPTLLPPLSAGALFRHLGRSPKYLPLVPIVGKSVGEVLRRWELWDFGPLRSYLDAVCQITVQASADEAEAPFALGAIDYFFRGTGHIRGGIGELAFALTDTIEALGGQVFFADAVARLEREGTGWKVVSRRRELLADKVVTNLLPQNVAEMLGRPVDEHPKLAGLAERVAGGWGAAMLYLGIDGDADIPTKSYHVEMVGDLGEPFIEGNHIFCSVGGADEPNRAPDAQRVATVSTHVDMHKLLALEPNRRGEYISWIQGRMRDLLARRAPEIAEAVVFEMTASPRTFARFTNRKDGFVGGIPRRAGLHNYRQMWPVEVEGGLYLVGDTVFPGQSTLAVALGGVRVADTIYRG